MATKPPLYKKHLFSIFFGEINSQFLPINDYKAISQTMLDARGLFPYFYALHTEVTQIGPPQHIENLTLAPEHVKIQWMTHIAHTLQGFCFKIFLFPFGVLLV